MNTPLSLLMVFAAFSAAAQDNAQEPSDERARLNAERVRIEQQHLQARQVCYQQFLVNSCLIDAKRQEREALAEIKRQERVLNTQERQRKANNQIQKMEERGSLENQEAKAQTRQQRVEEHQKRQERLADVAASASAPGKTPSSTGKPKPAPVASPTKSPAETASQRTAYDKKIEEAKRHRQDLEQRRRERTKPLAEPLPRH